MRTADFAARTYLALIAVGFAVLCSSLLSLLVR